MAAMSPLPTRKLGRSDLVVTVVGLGCNNFGRRIGLDETRAVIDAALDAGINLLDTAYIYAGEHGSSEELIGAALEGRRDRVIVATKFGMTKDPALPGKSGSAEFVRASCEVSLRRLRTDRIDLFQYHGPNDEVPLAETLGALEGLVNEGKVRHIGVSNFSAAQLEEACELAPVASLQNEYSLLRRDIERDVIPACEALGVGVLPYFPLASGLLSGKYRRGERAPDGSRLANRGEIASDADWDVLDALERFAAERDLELIDVAIGGLAAQPAIASVIAGAKTPEQARRNARAGLWQPSADDLEEIDRIAPSQRPSALRSATRKLAGS
jgi:aryl-alcohol dehydrogenase-like predicted oxidoreductase